MGCSPASERALSALALTIGYADVSVSEASRLKDRSPIEGKPVDARCQTDTVRCRGVVPIVMRLVCGVAVVLAIVWTAPARAAAQDPPSAQLELAQRYAPVL